MGGGGGHEIHHYHTQTVYQVPPETKKKLEEQTKQLQNFEAEAKRQKNPKLYNENSKKLFDNFVAEITKLTLMDIIKKETGDNHIGFIGPISTGKTSMINVLFDKNLPIALGHCTEKCEVVHVQGRNKIWDVSGTNSDFKFYEAESLSFLKGLDKCVILFDSDPATIEHILKVVHKINPRSMIVVRTKIDQHTTSNVRTIPEEKNLDSEKVSRILSGVKVPTYCVSSHNITNGRERHDWDTVKIKLGLV